MTQPRLTVDLDRAFLERVYVGDDLEGFARFVGLAVTNPHFLVYAAHPNTLGVLEIRESGYDLGRICYGHHLAGDWRLVRHALAVAKARGCRHLLYPIRSGRPNTGQLFEVLTRRYQFEPYQLLLAKNLEL